MFKRILISLFAFLVVVFAGNGQVVSLSPWNGVLPAIMNSAGGTYDNGSSYFRFEWSLGELALIQSFAPSDSSILVTHGVLQPCTDKVGLSPMTLLFEQGDYKLFPNPTPGKFEVDFFVKQPGQMNLQLINSVGQVLQQRSYYYDGCCRIEMFDLSAYPSGVYFVVADLKPDTVRSDGLLIIRHSGLKVVKIGQ